MIDLTASPNNSWTTRELRAWIKRATQDINREFLDIKETGVNLEKDNPLLYEQRNRLIELGTGKEYRGGVALGLAYKNKEELVIQARALRETYNVMESPQQEAENEDKVIQAYETFMSNRPTYKMSYSEYKEMTELLGAMGEHMFEQFGYEDFLQTYDEARTQKKKSEVDLLKAYVETKNEIRGQGKTTNQVIDALRDNLGL